MKLNYGEEGIADLAQKGGWQRWLGENDWGKRMGIGIVFVLLLALFLHFREVRIHLPELQKTAENYIISQVDFSFPDEPATQVLKEQALRDVGVIYRIEETEVRERRYDFENLMIHHQKWRYEYPTVTFEEVYKGADALEEALLQVHFTDMRTLQKMRELRLPMEAAFPVRLEEGQSTILLSKEFWGRIEKMVFIEGNFHPEAASLVLSCFENQTWTLEEDKDAEHALRQIAQENVPKVSTFVHAGTKIIAPGEKVTSRHVIMVKAMKHVLMEKRKLWEPLTLIGSLLLSFIFTAVSVVYLRIRHQPLFHSLHRLLLLTTIIILTLAIAKLTEYVLINKTNNLIDIVRYPLFVPFATILICILVGTDIALFASGFLAIILGVTLAVDHNRFLVINLIASVVTLIFARRLHKRNEVFIVFIKAWVSCIPVIIAFNLIENNFWNLNLMADMISSCLFMLATALLVVSLLPPLESFFHVMTDMTLMEYTDPNSELLRRLSLEAPGTYQHSLVVGNIAETAARSIGANGLFCRVATLYHDVGKLFNPHYFTENQLGGFNIHQLLTPQESAQVIIAHVAEGETLAKKYHLPQNFIDVIREHHGTTLAYYFYCRQVEQMDGDVNKVEERLFRYPGPKPRTKESAIIMIADCVEAASRSLDEVNETAVTDLVERLIAEKIEENQLDECQLTFEELGRIKKSIIKTLVVTRHLRIKYPARPF